MMADMPVLSSKRSRPESSALTAVSMQGCECSTSPWLDLDRPMTIAGRSWTVGGPLIALQWHDVMRCAAAL